MFEVTKSKMYSQIMESLVSFFGLDKEAATETEVHAAIEGQKPLAEQLESAKTAAIENLQTQLNDLNTRVSDAEAKVKELEEAAALAATDAETKAQRIAELQQDAGKAANAMEALKNQHKQEVDRLSGELAKSKAGAQLEGDLGGDPHEAGKDTGKANGPIVIKSDALGRLLKRKA